MTTSEGRFPSPGSPLGGAPVDWDSLRGAARAVRAHAYAPYSGYLVGAAALTADGRLLTGCNVENASFGITLCAECGVVSDLHGTGGGRLVVVACVGGAAGEPARAVLPCGRCRQLLAENGGGDLLVDGPDGPVTLETLLPHAFSAEEMDVAARGGAERAR
ncbi:MAG: cytidine deaminase [Jiangellales bacterium]